MEDVSNAIARNAALHPEATALIVEDEIVTWAHFEQLVDRASNYLALHTPGDRLALSLPNSIDLAFAIFGSIRAGKAVQILDPAWPAPLMRKVLDRLHSDFVLNLSNVSAFNRHVSSEDQPGMGIDRQADPSTPFYTGFTSGSTGIPKGFRRDQNSWLESFAATAICSLCPPLTFLWHWEVLPTRSLCTRWYGASTQVVRRSYSPSSGPTG